MSDETTENVIPADAPASGAESVFDVKDITLRFGGVVSLRNVSMHMNRGEILAVIGPNGAGKTTLFNVVSGLLAPKSGRVIIDGHDVTKAGPSRRARRGLSRTYQRLELFTSLTVRDNIRVAGEIRNTWGRRARIDATTGANVASSTRTRSSALWNR